MSIERFGIQLLACARDSGASFEEVLMVGRQNLNIRPEEVGFAEELLGFSVGDLVEKGRDLSYAEPLFMKLGASKIDSIDYTDYEGAAIKHDMNSPIPEALENKYDIVYDGGSIEHIFNAPQALSNCMRLVKPGGLYIVVTPSNNLSGHGFFQFSPEFFYRTLNSENGFEVKELLVGEVFGQRKMFRVSDSAVLKKRFEFRTKGPAYIAVIARKISSKVPFENVWPQQADYTVRWDGESPDGDSKKGLSVKRRIMNVLPERYRRQLRRWRRQRKARAEMKAGLVEIERLSKIDLES